MSSEACGGEQISPKNILALPINLSEPSCLVERSTVEDAPESSMGLNSRLKLAAEYNKGELEASRSDAVMNHFVNANLLLGGDEPIASVRLDEHLNSKVSSQEEFNELKVLHKQSLELGGFVNLSSKNPFALKTAASDNIDDLMEIILHRRTKDPKPSLFQSASGAAKPSSGARPFCPPYPKLKTNKSFKVPEKRSREELVGESSVKENNGSELVFTQSFGNRLPTTNFGSLTKQAGVSEAGILRKRQRAELEAPSAAEPEFLKPSNLPALKTTKPSSVLSLKKANLKVLETSTPFKSPQRKKPVVPTVTDPIPKIAFISKPPTTRSSKNLLTVLYEEYGELPVTHPSSTLIRKLSLITISTAFQVRFNDTNWGLKEAKAEFQAQGADEDWVSNHYSQIVWKLACLVRSYSACQTRWSTLQVRKELSQRLQKEGEMGSSSVIKAIVEQTYEACFYFVAVVSRVHSNGFFLTDGWYEIKCFADAPLQRALEGRRILVGQKLGICGAELNSPGPMPVLEGLHKASLSLSSNGVRRARWDTRLGYQVAPFFPVQIANIHSDGKRIPFIDATILHKSPLKFLTKTDHGNVIRTYDEELAYRESNSLSDFESTPFFSVRLVDGGAREAVLTIWRTGLARYQSLEEGKRYQFFHLAPASSQKNKAALELVSTKITNWSDAVRTGHVLPTRDVVLVSQLANLSNSTEVHLAVGYLGAALNGFAFIDSSRRLLVIRPPPSQRDALIKLKIRSIVGLESFKVADYFPKFDLQVLDFGYDSVIRSDAAFALRHPSLRLFLDENQAYIEKALEDAIKHTETDLAPPASGDTVELMGKFTGWKWFGQMVDSTFVTLDGQIQSLKLPPSQWKSALALTLRGPSLDRFKDNLTKGQFVDATHFPPATHSRYIKLHEPMLKCNYAYQIVSAVMALPSYPPSLFAVWKREFKNLAVYFSKRACLYRFKVTVDPRSAKDGACLVTQITALDGYHNTPSSSQMTNA